GRGSMQRLGVAACSLHGELRPMAGAANLGADISIVCAWSRSAERQKNRNQGSDSQSVQDGGSLAGNDSSEDSSTISRAGCVLASEALRILVALRRSGGFTHSSPPYRPEPAQATCTAVTLTPAAASFSSASASAPGRSCPWMR